MGALIGLLRRNGMRKGVLGGDRRWLTIWAVVATGSVMRRLFKQKPVVERITLKPGETITITDLAVAERDLGDPQAAL
jgi:hypothetical protein